MLLLVKGGNLNMLNDEGFTPLAYGSERIINLLDLKAGVATFDKQGTAIKELPEEYDNNYLLNRGNWKQPQEDPTAKMKYRPIGSPKDSIRSGDRAISQYIQPDDIMDRLIKKNESLEQETSEIALATTSKRSSP